MNAPIPDHPLALPIRGCWFATDGLYGSVQLAPNPSLGCYDPVSNFRGLPRDGSSSSGGLSHVPVL